MTILYGYAGKVLEIDIGRQTAQHSTTPDFLSRYDIDPRLWLGGDGFITKILWKDFPEPIDPLGPENEIILSTGPWTATAAPQSGRGMLGCIDPETGGFGSGSFGWMFPSALKYAGLDIVIIRGTAKKPIYIFIDDGQVRFKDASRIWGKETGETVRLVRQELAEQFEGQIRVLSTSIAGENKVIYAPPCADGTSCPGRTGAGAVMGSKNLKAVAVRGTGEIRLVDSKGLLDESFESVNTFLEKEPLIELWQKFGSTTALSTSAGWPLNGTMLADNRKKADIPHQKNVGCLNCFNPCYHWLQLKEGKYSGLRQLGGHMTFVTESLRNFGITDFGEWIYFERLMQELGMDPASFSMAFSWAVDCFEKGLLSHDQTDGLVLKRKDAELIWKVARKTAARQGALGNLLADGVAAAARHVGGEAQHIAPHVRGKAYIQRDPKIQALMWALGFLTSPRGGDWLRLHNIWELAFMPEKMDRYPQFTGKTCKQLFEQAMQQIDMPDDLKNKIFGPDQTVDVGWVKGTKGKVLFSIWSENFVALFNSLVTCMFGGAAQFLLVGFGPTTYSKILNTITGWDTDYEELMTAGERIFNLQRLFNYRLNGWDRRQDVWADKRAYEPGTMGIYKGRKVPWDKILDEYYRLRGWTERGLPSLKKLKSLQIDDHAQGLKL